MRSSIVNGSWVACEVNDHRFRFKTYRRLAPLDLHLTPHTTHHMDMDMDADDRKIVLVLRHGGRRDHHLRWDTVRCLPCEVGEWMDLVGPTTENCVLTAHIDQFDGSELVDICDHSVDIVLDLRGLTAADDHMHRIFWQTMNRKLGHGGYFLGCKSVFTRRRKFLAGVRDLFQGSREHMRARAGNFKMFAVPAGFAGSTFPVGSAVSMPTQRSPHLKVVFKSRVTPLVDVS